MCRAGCIGGIDYATVRLAAVEMVLGCMRFHLRAVGPAYTSLSPVSWERYSPDRLRGEDRLELVWQDVQFHALHPLLGRVAIRLDPRREGESRGEIVPLPGAKEPTDGGFFPAENRNRLFFTVHLPRFRRVFFNDSPVVNSAVITGLPPFGTPYPMHESVKFSTPQRPRLTIEIAECIVRTMLEENVRVGNLRSSVERGMTYLSADISNVSPARSIRVGWFVDTTHGVRAQPAMGFLTLTGRRPATVRIALDPAGHKGATEVAVSAGISSPAQVEGASCSGTTVTFDEPRFQAADSRPIAPGKSAGPT